MGRAGKRARHLQQARAAVWSDENRESTLQKREKTVKERRATSDGQRSQKRANAEEAQMLEQMLETIAKLEDKVAQYKASEAEKAGLENQLENERQAFRLEVEKHHKLLTTVEAADGYTDAELSKLKTVITQLMKCPLPSKYKVQVLQSNQWDTYIYSDKNRAGTMGGSSKPAKAQTNCFRYRLDIPMKRSKRSGCSAHLKLSKATSGIQRRPWRLLHASAVVRELALVRIVTVKSATYGVKAAIHGSTSDVL